MSIVKAKQLPPTLYGCLFLVCQLGCAQVPSTKELSSPNRDVNSGLVVAVTRIEKVGDIPVQDERGPDGFQFIDENHGWLFWHSHLWQTSDAGKTWLSIYAPDPTAGSSVLFQFISPKLGWSSSIDTLQKTEDGGRTWTPINSPIDRDKGEISSVRFLKDGKRGWLAGGIYHPVIEGKPENEGLKHMYQNAGKAPRGNIFYTDDAGLTWRQQFNAPYLGSFINRVYVSNDHELWAFDDTGLYHLDGDKWKTIQFGKGTCVNRNLRETVGLDRSHHDIYEILGLFFASPMHGWLTFRNGYVAKTVDGGQTWCDLLDGKAIQEQPGEVTALADIYFINLTNGLALSSGGALYATRDGGATWAKTDATIRFSHMYFLDPQHGWAVAREGLFRLLP